MSSNRRRILVPIFVLAVSAIVVLLAFSTVENLGESSEQEAFAFVYENLVRKIVEYEPDEQQSTNNPRSRILMDVDQAVTDENETLPNTPRWGNYTVVSVVPHMKTVGYEGGRTRPTRATNSDSNGRFWLTSPGAIDEIVRRARDQERSYVWIQMSQPVDLSLIQRELSAFDAVVLGYAGDLVRLHALNDKKVLRSIRDIAWVSGIGVLPPKLKISQSFQEEIRNSNASERLPVFVSVVSAESESVFRSALTDMGISVGHYDPSIRVFAVVINPAQVYDIIQLDFVQAVEPIPIVTVAHDTAVPAQGVDKLRNIGNLAGIFSDITGSTTPVGVMDTGLNTNHVDISTFRQSICAKNFVANEELDLWHDAIGHGTHVTGTIAGNGYFVPKYAGMAPGVQHMRFAKVLSAGEHGSSLDIFLGMDFMAEQSSCIWDGQETRSVRPLIVNMSFSSARLDNDSRSASARKLDSMVWAHRQLYVVSNANSSQRGYSNYGAAKNSLPVGAAFDSGEIYGFSSRGPTIDNRLTPLVTGTGVDVRSVAGGGSYDEYGTNSGTSMAAPSVAGLAALLMDASPAHRAQPALVRARLMASAIKPNAWLESERQFPLNNTNGPGEAQSQYGMGMVSATATILNNDSENGWTSSGVSVEMENDQYAYHDIEIPEDSSRLDIVMTWDEPPTDSIANNVLNDLDLWVDRGADCGDGPCGEHSSTSKIDNVEWIIIRNPDPGTYRLKIDAVRVYGDAPRAAVAWTIIRGDSTPQLTIEANQEVYESSDGEYHSHKVDLTISTDSYVAKGVSLHVDCRTLEGKTCSLGRTDTRDVFWEGEHSVLVQRSDGVEVARVGEQFVLGEITEGTSTNVLLNLYAESSEPMRVYVKAMAWNGEAGHTSFLLRPAGSIDDVPAASSPSNDDFDTPRVLDGPNGRREFDLLASSMEDGEPLHEDALGLETRATGSVWFQRVAEQSGLASFVATPTNRDFPNRTPKVQVYQVSDACCGISGARLLASADWSAQLFVEEGYVYRIRVSVDGDSLPLALNWFQGDRPINDSFAHAIELSDKSGEISGNNLGATLEAGELYGYLSSSVWYQWTAPEDGRWEFQIPDAEVIHILAFVGDVVSDLRMVSNFVAPGDPIAVHAKKGRPYRIMVASPDAYSGGWSYDALTWNKVEQPHHGNDLFEDATYMGNEESGSIDVSHDSWPGIEPDEPESTGVQSRWWRWQAPYEGQFTFFWTGEHDQAVEAFMGSSMANLQSAILKNDLATETEFVIEAQQDEEFWISVGREKFDSYAFSNRWTNGELKWGPTPSNDTVEHATMLVGDRGELTDSTLFATSERDGWAHLGSSSMWYIHEVSEPKWVKFWIESSSLNTFRLAAFHRRDENSDREFVMASRRYAGQRDHVVEVIVYVDEGMQVLLRVANESKHQGKVFKLRWEATDAPNWITYIGSLSYGRRDGAGNISRIQQPREISINSDGSAVYITTEEGLHAYRRESESGELTLVQVHDYIPAESHHTWDPHRSKLYVNFDSTWWTFATAPEDAARVDLVDSFEEQAGIYTFNHLGVPTLVLGGNGDYLYRLELADQRVYDFSSQGRIQHYGTYRDPQQSVSPSYDGHYWYGFNDSRSRIYKNERILGSPFYERMSESSELQSGEAWLVQNDHSNMFTFVATRSDLHIFNNKSASGEFIQLVSEFNYANELSWCGGSFVRKNRFVVDLICSLGSVVLEYDSSNNDVYVTDKSAEWQPDRFGRMPPRNHYLWRGNGVEASPDGRHIYASTFDHGIVIYERFGNSDIDLEDKANLPVLRLDLLRVGDGLVQFGDDSVNDGCLESNSWTVGDFTYTVESSKWQEREEGSEWFDVEGTTVNSQLCIHVPEENREYRMLASINIDGNTSEFASNFFARVAYEQFDDLVVSSGKIELSGEANTDCFYLSDTQVGDKSYTVFNAKWQSRPDSDSTWKYVRGTETSGELCTLTATEGLEYRLVGSIMVDGVRGHRRSNIMQSGGLDE